MLEKNFLTSLNKVESAGLTFVSLKDVYVVSRRQDPERCEVVRPVVYISSKASIRELPHLTRRLRGGMGLSEVT